MKNICEILIFSASKYPSKPAIIFGQKKISFSELNIFTDRLAQGLRESGVAKGDRVALLLDNSPHFIICYFAIMKLGAIVVPINHMFKSEEISYIISDSQIPTLITSFAYLDIVIKIKEKSKCLKNILATSKEKEEIFSIYEWAYDSAKQFNPENVGKDDIAAILYTSGTTGHPKGAMLSHGNLISNVLASKEVLKVTHKDKTICILPLFHSFAATVCMLLPLYAGGAVVVMKSARPFKRTIRAILRNKVTVFVGIPSLYNILKEIKLPKILDSFIIRFLLPVRVCISGAAALPISTWERFQRRFRVPLLEGYGLTEASPVVSLNPYKGINKGGSIGLPINGVEVDIVNEKNESVNVGQVGEILVKGPNVMRGYFNKPGATQETIKDGWLHTGDLGKRDQDGYIYIVGRKKDMVNVRGLNVYPREIEDLLYEHPKVKEVAVIGVSDYHKGEVPKGFVVLKERVSATERELILYLREHLANYKIPRYIEFRQSLPKNTTGKILKRVLIEEEHNQSISNNN
ncbi:MAG: long-chain fatty acid--CoA ligase [Candidatus Omnitrophica bacterium]|nr:long-chain fatty acid--CoA ligase [Candidatus Omnitrophota bacterium]